ncbi:MAG: bacillithiol biosynthesis cysteine-adding enzyme BshC [Flavobacteriaceae bacterium]
MKILGIPFAETNYTSPLISDYLNQHSGLKPFYRALPDSKTLQEQAINKTKDFAPKHRNTLVTVLQQQYKDLKPNPAVLENIALLEEPQTVTVTTGHQLNLMTGPLYFIYKIISTIKLAQQLNAQWASIKVVPIYWMATEDHDFEEINHFDFKGEKLTWSKPTSGPVGLLDLDGLAPLLKTLESTLGISKNADEIRALIAESYGKANTLTAATRLLVDRLFGSYGLVCLDADNHELKTLFIPQMEEELHAQTSFNCVSDQILNIQKQYNASYKPQVNPRAINLFYLHKKGRLRIEKNPSGFSLADHPIHFEDTALLDLLHKHPERFSPNVLMRPLYQEVILPNICYIGGGGELAYWLQLSSYFESQKVAFPLLLLRNSALLLTDKQLKKSEALDLKIADLFQKQKILVEQKVREISQIDLDLAFLKTALEHQFAQLEQLAQQTDASFLGSVAAQRVKQLKGIDRLEKRLLKAQKRKLADHTQRIVDLQQQLFPQGQLQERVANFFSFYLDYGVSLIPMLLAAFEPLGITFDVIRLTFDKKEK